MAELKSVSLVDEDWQKILKYIANSVVWSEANPLLMKIGNQLQQQTPRPRFTPQQPRQGPTLVPDANALPDAPFVGGDGHDLSG